MYKPLPFLRHKEPSNSRVNESGTIFFSKPKLIKLIKLINIMNRRQNENECD